MSSYTYTEAIFTFCTASQPEILNELFKHAHKIILLCLMGVINHADDKDFVHSVKFNAILL